eukprot:CAMPEP_0197506476 /NCGR_PEP_ID=MMETSP1312-20131121/7366_1 /TAXON_ID=464262 /ORGANISM="Genus nov. species nov., Strain RCC2335" /LENGTH=125 /DNA_ID=CAMNT_0043053755 /DNA_START=1767 /DNA_END=2141 /DNA_ORIENTATION=+
MDEYGTLYGTSSPEEETNSLLGLSADPEGFSQRIPPAWVIDPFPWFETVLLDAPAACCLCRFEGATSTPSDSSRLHLGRAPLVEASHARRCSSSRPASDESVAGAISPSHKDPRLLCLRWRRLRL